MAVFLIYLAVFIGVLIAVDTLLRLARDRMQKRSYINYRLSLIEKDADRNVVYRQMLKERGIDADAQQSISNYFSKLYIQSDLKLTPVQIAIRVLIALAGSYLLIAQAGFSSLISVLLTMASAIAICWMYLARSRAKRISVFTAQLPDAIDVIVRSLSAGHPLPISIALVARETSDPVGSEFGIMSDELTYGTDVDDAVRNMATRVGASELNLLAISLGVQKGSGGNLSEILASLADMIRKRTMMRSKIRAISAEGRMTAWFMAGFPFFLYGIIKLIHADYFTPLWQSGYGNHFLITSAILLTIGMLVIRKIINFDY